MNKLTLAGEVRDLDGFVRAVSGQWLVSDYQHQEIESGAVATTFKNKGSDLRLQAEHKKFDVAGGSLGGVFGLQTENNDFSALGDEAFVPSTTTRQFALFVLEELSWGDTTLSLGGRVGRDKVDSDGDAPGQTQFGPAQSRTFTPFSAAIGGIHKLTPQWQLSGNLAYTERAPTFYELYANGLHVATGAYEVGNPDMAIEKGSNLDVALQWKDGANRVKAGAFYSDFSNYIALLATGQEVDTDEGEVPVFDFTGVPAKLYGFEVEGNWRVLDSAQQVDLDGKLDLMRATNEAIDQPLPRIPPARLTAGVNWKMGDWGARAEVIYAAEQDRVPTYDLPTPAYTLVNLSASYKLRMAGTEGFFFARLNNLTNELAYNATTHRHGAAAGAAAGARADGGAAAELLGSARGHRHRRQLTVQAGDQPAELGVVAQQRAARGDELIDLLVAQRQAGGNLVQEAAQRQVGHVLEAQPHEVGLHRPLRRGQLQGPARQASLHVLQRVGVVAVQLDAGDGIQRLLDGRLQLAGIDALVRVGRRVHGDHGDAPRRRHVQPLQVVLGAAQHFHGLQHRAQAQVVGDAAVDEVRVAVCRPCRHRTRRRRPPCARSDRAGALARRKQPWRQVLAQPA